MTLAGLIEALGLGAAGHARSLVGRLPAAGLVVATSEGIVARALERAGHRTGSIDVPAAADAALLLSLPEGDEALPLLERLVAAVRTGGSIIVADDTGAAERARTAGLLLRVGLMSLRQDIVDGTVYTSGQVRPASA